MNYEEMSIENKLDLLLTPTRHVKSEQVRYKINADYLKCYCQNECYRELMVSYIPMLPLIEKTVKFEEADYILYMHSYAKCDDMSEWVVQQLKDIAKRRKKGAEIIVVGKAANAEKILNGEIDNITFWGDHFTEKLGKKFGFDIKEQYFVYDDMNDFLAIWPVDGCLQKCKFCRRSYMHIKFESITLEVIKKNLDFIKEHNPERLKNINLRAENLTEYRLDIYGKPMLHELIKLIESYAEVKNIVLGIGVAIGEITEEILDVFCTSTKIRRIAMNIEAGTDRLLQVIGKNHTCKRVEEIFCKIKKENPSIKISSIVMIGLPTETINDIYELADLIKKTRIDFLKCNYYISSKNHPLANLPQISTGLREYHLEILLKLLENVHHNISIESYSIRKSKKGERKKDKIRKDNEKAAENGFFPVHESQITTITTITLKK